jgi:hypothetical protein
MTIRVTAPPGNEPEKTWVIDVLLRHRLGAEVALEWCASAEHYTLSASGGGVLHIPDVFFKHGLPVDRADWLFPERPVWLEGASVMGLYGASQVQPDGIGMDLFGSAFFLLSRWEESLPGPRDGHGRFLARDAFLGKHGLLGIPHVEVYAEYIAARLGLASPAGKRRFQLQFSCDVDHPRLWWHPADRFRTLAGETLRGGLRAFGWWASGRITGAADPFDVFDEWMDLLETCGLTGHFNMMGPRPEGSDAWYDLDHPEVGALLKRIQHRGHVIGFHPSYEGWNDPAAFRAELEGLEQRVGQPVRSGRQHYLRFSPETTWRIWSDAGMAFDSTLGYADQPGFRCGTCLPYPVFDLSARQPLPLWERPLIIMDVSLAIVQGCTPAQGRAIMDDLTGQVRRYGGEMVLLWHNSSWNTYFWAPWKPVLREYLIQNT